MKRIVISFAIVGCIVLIGSGIWVFLQKQTVLGVVSPLSEEAFKDTEQYRFVFDQKTTTESFPPNDYFPLSLSPELPEAPDINAQAYGVMDRSTRKLLVGKNITEELPIASVTKIMTAVVALENADLDKEITVSSSAADIGEAEMGLTAGERVSVEQLLYGLMLPSGNDAAETLAEGVSTSRTSFIIAMNETGKRLGLYDTYYFNPSGLDGKSVETTSFSTVLDLFALTNYALNNPTFSKIVSTYYHEFPYEEGKHKAFYLYNILQLDKTYPGIKGVKPGNTDFAKETLVSYAENGGRELILVLLGTQNSRDEAIKLYDYIFRSLGVAVPGRT